MPSRYPPDPGLTHWRRARAPPPRCPQSQNASAAFPESARAYPAAGHAPGRRSTRDRATNICWRLLVRTMPGQNCIDPRALEDRPRRFMVGILRAPKTWTLKKLGCGVNFPSGGIARICVGRHSGIDADSDTWHQRAGADVPHGWSTFPTITCTGRTSMPIKSAGIVPELLREPSQEWSGGGWRAASTFLPRSEARPIRIPYNRSRANSARRELGRLIAPRRLAS